MTEKKKDILGKLHEKGKENQENMPEFDVEKTLEEAKKKDKGG